MARRGNSEGSIYQRADGRWVASLFEPQPMGPATRTSIYGRTRVEVAAKLRAAQHRVDTGRKVGNSRDSVGSYLERWLTESLPGSVRPRTLESYASTCRLHLIPALGHLRLGELDADHVEAFLAAKSKSVSARGTDLSPRSVAYMHAVLRLALDNARRRGYVDRNVAALVKPPRVSRHEIVPYTVEDARTLLSVAASDRLYALYSVAVAIGLRKGEALGLHWSDVDLDAGTLHVRVALQRVGGRLEFAEPKTARSRRTISLPETSVEVLRDHRARQDAERLAAVIWADCDLVFTTPIGTPIDPRNVNRQLDALIERAGIRRLRFHDLRHTCATLLLAQGVDLRVIMQILGHSTVSTTADIYIHVLPTLQQDAASRMDALLRDGR